MRDAGFLLFGCQVFTDDLHLDSESKLTDDQKEAATLAMSDLASRRLVAKILIVGKFQVVAITDLEYDLAMGAISVADVRGVLFRDRLNRTSGI